MAGEPKVWDEDTFMFVHGASRPAAGATYTAAEQATINAILDILRSAGLMATD